MKKDYIPVSAEGADIDEALFAEQYWTSIWDERRLEEQAVQVERYEEFKIVDRYLSKLPEDARIFDGGCGLGEWTVYYSQRGYQVVGLDISHKTIQRLEQVFPECRFVTGDIRNTGFDADYFDAYFSWGVFEHFESGLGVCLEEARRILKPGGYLLISVPFQNGRHLRRDGRDLSRWDKNYDRERGYLSEMRFYQWRLTRPELHREFEIHGFKPLQVEAIHKWHGLHRTIKTDLGIDAGPRMHRALQICLYPFYSKNYISHMILGVGQKK